MLSALLAISVVAVMAHGAPRATLSRAERCRDPRR